MGYRLGVDLGTSFTAATIGRAGAAQHGSLGSDSAIVPSVVFVGENGEREYGFAAAEQAGTEPHRLLRGFVRRIGDETPMLPEAGAPTAAHRVAADFVAWLVKQASAQEGRAPEAVAVTHPANWGPHKRDLFLAALRDADVPGATLVAEPVATALAGTIGRDHAPGAVVGVYDLGGRTFDAALVRREADGTWSLHGAPAGLPDLGGADLDDLVLGHVIAGLTPDQQQALGQLDADDDDVTAAMAGLRSACVAAKEALSAQTTTVVEVKLPGVSANVRLTRAEFEAMSNASIEATIDVLDAVVDSAGLVAADLDYVLIAGGSSRIPLVTQLISRHFHVPVVTAGGKHAATAIAAGAVLALGAMPVPAVPAQPTVKAARRSLRVTKPAKEKAAPKAIVPAPAPEPVIPPAPAKPAAVKPIVPGPAKPVAPVAPAAAASVEAPKIETPKIAAPKDEAAKAETTNADAAPAVELPLPDPSGPTSKPIRSRRVARRSEIVGLEGLAASPAEDVPVHDGPRAVIPARKIAAVAAPAEHAVRVEPVRPAARVEVVRAEDMLPPPRPAMDSGFEFVDDVEDVLVEDLEAGWTWRSMFSVRRSVALTALTAAIYVGATAWIPATPAITDQSSSSSSSLSVSQHVTK